MSEVHLCDVNPEYVSEALEDDRLLKQTAQSIGIDATILRNKLRDAWYSDRSRFDEVTLWVIDRKNGRVFDRPNRINS